MDSNEIETKTDSRIKIGTISLNDTILEKTKIIKETGWAVPLLVVNLWQSRKMCYQGSEIYTEDWEQSFAQNLKKESIRSGVFSLDSTNYDYRLDVTIDELTAKGPYTSNGVFVFFVLFYFFSFGDYAGPAQSSLVVSYQLFENEKIVHSGSLQSVRETEQLKVGYKNSKELIQGFANSMAEATSQNYKQVIESLVSEVNSYFEEK